MARMKMGLRPAIKYDGKVYVGQRSDSHNSAASYYGIPAPEDKRGFSPDGKLFLDRQKAVGWVRYNEPDVFSKLHKLLTPDGMHSEQYAKAKGIQQNESAIAAREGSGTSKLGREVSKGKSGDDGGTGAALNTKTAIVYDRGGLYLYCAEKLAEKYKKVYYFLADSDAYPSSKKHTIGAGLAKVERIYDLWEHLDKADIVYQFDCYDGSLGHYLSNHNIPVFSSKLGEKVEIDKIYFLELLEKLELPCPETQLCEGMDELKEYLEKHDGETLWLKNLHRGDFETKKFRSMAQIKPFLDDLRKRIGTASDTMEVLVQSKIDSVCEAGYDGFQVDGQFTNNCIIGYEAKDAGFVGKIFSETPEILKHINDAFSDTFKELGYRGNYSTEVRITKDGVPYFIDPTCRVPSPPGELMVELYENWAEATWEIAHGILPTLKPIAKFGAEIILTSDWYNEHELHVTFPKKYKQNVKLKNHTVRDGEYYCVPNENGAFFGAVVAWGDTMREAISNVKKIAKEVEADELKYDDGIFDSIQESVNAGKAFGLGF